MGRLYAETKEAQARDTQHGMADHQREHRDDRADDVGNDMTEDDYKGRSSDSLCAFDEVGVFNGSDLASGKPCVGEPAENA